MSDGNVKLLIKSLNSQKKCLRSLEVVFDLCKKGLMQITGDGKANMTHFANTFLEAHKKSIVPLRYEMG